MAVPVVEVVDALQVAMQLLALVQQAQVNGQTTIAQSDFDAAVADRNAALTKLDADIAALEGKAP